MATSLSSLNKNHVYKLKIVCLTITLYKTILVKTSRSKVDTLKQDQFNFYMYKLKINIIRS